MAGERQPRGMSFFAYSEDDAGIIFENFITAVHVWTWMRPCDRQTTVQEVADQFGVTPKVVRVVVKGHPWMYLVGDDDDPAQFIDHDGD